jgi:hypothetical protein
VNGGVAFGRLAREDYSSATKESACQHLSQHSAGAFKFAQWILNGAGSRRRNKSAERAASNQALTNDV